ncbi:MAG: hypothetical protein HN704_07585 [Bacteroidetes bacterium]|jgi:hypothetical protein|nr:hypothetical protein [Bacteroidota bacterium]MBT6685305.1 hypothetical protein [Bacteroidota bacterium]MBT7143428.1 hypothetical protein [Bacteroidota bacterium]MBT7491450.1 hypothetical protein [Bacteroidota bacterium]
MKKLFLIISLVAFLGATTVSSYAAPKNDNTVNVDEEKCKVCGKEDCKDKGKCSATATDGKTSDKSACKAEAKKDCSKKCGPKAKSSCCSKKAKKSSCSSKHHSKNKTEKE